MTADVQPEHSPAVEDYVKHIYKLTQAGERATTKALAERMGLGQGTVSGMVKQLAARGLVEHRPYYGVRLTEAGLALALQMIRRHRLIELFLVNILGLGWHEVDRESERLEHAVSERVIERIDELLGKPDVDPHGAPIPDAAGQIEPQSYRLLADLSPGEAGEVRRVSDADPQFLEFLEEQGVKLHDRVQVVSIGPFGSMHVRIGKRSTRLPREATERIAVAVGEG